MSSIKVIKIGGNVIGNPEKLEKFLDDFATIPSPKVLIHGGGKEATELAKKLGVEVKMHQGRRITNKPMLDVAVMVYGGLINKQLCASLQKRGVNALGLSGADADCVRAVKRESKEIDWGYVGDVIPGGVDGSFIQNLLENGITPVFCALTHDGNGNLLNTNADTMATEIASSLSAGNIVDLVFCFEKKGVLLNSSDEDSVIEKITPEYFEKLKESEIVSEGMIPKIENAIKALEGGVSKVLIKSAENLLNTIQTTVEK